MLALEWDELDLVSADITRLQVQRQAAKTIGNVERASVLSNELARAVTKRDSLILRITERVGAGALVDGPRLATRVH